MTPKTIGAWPERLVESGYVGWVAYVDGSPIFEEVPRPAGAYPVLEGSGGVEFRAGGRRTMEWKELPHEKVQRVELYFPDAEERTRLAFRLDREPGHTDLRFLQLKVGGVVLPTAGETGPRRLPVQGYRIGYWDPLRPIAELWEVGRSGVRRHGSAPDPWAPRPVGLGLSRQAFGL